ncbi:MAG: hypothetical protein WDN28_24500 [Chthoniobacter sp.]
MVINLEWYLLMKSFLALGILIFLKIDAWAIPSDRLRTGLAAALDYPKERMEIQDQTANMVRKMGDEIFLFYRVKSVDNTLAPLSLAVVKQGMVFTPDLQAHCQEVIKNFEKEGRPSPIRRLDLGNGVFGYTGLGVVGPGGEEEMLVVTDPNKRNRFSNQSGHFS